MTKHWGSIVLYLIYLILLTAILILVLLVWLIPPLRRSICRLLARLISIILGILKILCSWVLKACPSSEPTGDKYHTITATKTGNGSITPQGPVQVLQGQNQSFQIQPDLDHRVEQVLVDGTPLSPPMAPGGGSHTFSNVTADHTIEAHFEIKTYTITVLAPTHGQVQPPGPETVNHGDTPSFTFTPDGGYHLSDVLVDGLSVGSASPHTFAPVTADHTIEARFEINTYTLQVQAGANGTITPSGSMPVQHGAQPVFAIEPDPGFCVQQLQLDGQAVGFDEGSSSYTLPPATSDHTVDVSFHQCLNLICPTAMVARGSTSTSPPFSATAEITANKTFGDPLGSGAFNWETSSNLSFVQSTEGPHKIVVSTQPITEEQEAWVKLTYTTTGGGTITAECRFPIMVA